MYITRKFIVFFFAFVVSQFAVVVETASAADNQTQPKPDLIALVLPGLVYANGEGAYANIYNALKSQNLISNWTPLPRKRARRSFFDGEAACLSPADANLLKEYDQDLNNFVISAPFNNIKAELLINDLPANQSTKKPTLATLAAGNQYGIDIANFEQVTIPSYTRMIRLLNANRVNAAYVVYPDVMDNKSAYDLIKEFSGTRKPVWQTQETIICRKEFTQDIVHISSQINAWRTSGKLAEKIGRFYISD